MMKSDNPVIIFGANHLGRAAREAFDSNGRVVYGFLDEDKKLHGSTIDGVTVLGGTDDDGFLKLIDKKCDAFVATDDLQFHKGLVKMLRSKRRVMPVNAINRQAIISPAMEMGHGNFVQAGAMLGTGVQLGNYDLIHMAAVLCTGARIGDHVQVGAGAVLNAEVVVEDEVFIGSGVIVVAGVSIGKGARIGAGSVVIRPVASGATVFGNPAEVVKRKTG